jgi:lambda family phage portal protein
MKRDPVFDAMFGETPTDGSRTIDVSSLPVAPGVRVRDWSGDKFQGGFGPTDVFWPDYWTLRERSNQLFRSNLYARGVLRRLVQNIVNTGLHLEATPAERVLGVEPDSLADWTEFVEQRFELWAQDPALCHAHGRLTFGGLQATIELEALVGGDVLIVLQQGPEGLPRVRVVNASRVRTPLGYVPGKNPEIMHGVELDAAGRHVAYHIVKDAGGYERLPAFGRTGRRLAWLVYGTDKRCDDVRGEPLFSLMLQSLREIDRYRDSTQRKAVLNSMLALFVAKAEKGTVGTRPFVGGGAVRRSTETVVDSAGQQRSFKAAEFNPGMVIDELEVGEEPKGFGATGTDEKFGDFEKAIVSAIAWANGIPPEILTLAFSNNYSASQAAINEFKLVLTLERTNFGAAVCQPIYVDWLISEGLRGLPEVRTALAAWRDPAQRLDFDAWIAADWAGQIKPSTDLLKTAKGMQIAIAEGFTTRARAAREYSGQKFSRVVQQLARENAALVEANRSLSELDQPAAPAGGGGEGEDEDNEEREAG